MDDNLINLRNNYHNLYDFEKSLRATPYEWLFPNSHKHKHLKGLGPGPFGS